MEWIGFGRRAVGGDTQTTANGIQKLRGYHELAKVHSADCYVAAWMVGTSRCGSAGHQLALVCYLCVCAQQC